MSQASTFRWRVDAHPRIRVAGVFPINDRRFEFRYQSPTHAIHLYDYHGAIRMDQQEHTLMPGTLTISPAGLPTWYDLPRPGQHLCIHFQDDPNATGPAVTLPRWQPLGDAQGEAAQRLARITRLHAMVPRNEAAGVLSGAASVAIQDFLLWLAMLSPMETAADRPARPLPTPDARDPIDGLMELINRRLHRPLRVPELAEQVGWSQNYLSRMFRRRTGMTIPRYILQQRIERARLLLLTTDLPVKQVGARVGLPDPQYFNKQMRHVLGASPTRLRAIDQRLVTWDQTCNQTQRFCRGL